MMLYTNPISVIGRIITSNDVKLLIIEFRIRLINPPVLEDMLVRTLDINRESICNGKVSIIPDKEHSKYIAAMRIPNPLDLVHASFRWGWRLVATIGRTNEILQNIEIMVIISKLEIINLVSPNPILSSSEKRGSTNSIIASPDKVTNNIIEKIIICQIKTFTSRVEKWNTFRFWIPSSPITTTRYQVTVIGR